MVEKDEDISIGQLLGKIFYAAAIADKVIREKEIIRMNDFKIYSSSRLVVII